MPLQSLTGQQFDRNKFSFGKISSGGVVYAYVNYTKGNESDVTISFSVIENELGSTEYVLTDFGTDSPRTIILNTNTISVYAIDVPISCDDIIVSASFNGGTTPTSTSLAADGSTTQFTTTLTTPVVPGTVSVTYTIGATQHTANDDSNGNIAGTNVESGSIDYDSGAFSITFSSAPDNLTNIDISYEYDQTGTLVVDLQDASWLR